METKEAIARHQEDIEFDIRQIDFHKKNLLNAEYSIKLWRVFKMTDELFLWLEKSNNFTLYKEQCNRLIGIQNKLKKQYGKI